MKLFNINKAWVIKTIVDMILVIIFTILFDLLDNKYFNFSFWPFVIILALVLAAVIFLAESFIDHKFKKSSDN